MPVRFHAPGPDTEVYCVFCGHINQVSTQRLAENLSQATLADSNITHVHLAFQSYGGVVGDAFFLHNLLKAFPVALTIYNIGAIESAGVTVYLGAKTRKAVGHATFMIHRATRAIEQPTTAFPLQSIAQSLLLDDTRTETLLRNYLSLDDESWSAYNYGCDVILPAGEAKKAGLVNDIADFAPPAGTPIYSL